MSNKGDLQIALVAMSASMSGTGFPRLPVAGSIMEHSEVPTQKDPFRASCDREIPARSVAMLWVMLPATVNGAEAPPIEMVPMVTGIPHCAARMIWSVWVLA